MDHPKTIERSHLAFLESTSFSPRHGHVIGFGFAFEASSLGSETCINASFLVNDQNYNSYWDWSNTNELQKRDIMGCSHPGPAEKSRSHFPVVFVRFLLFSCMVAK